MKDNGPNEAPRKRYRKPQLKRFEPGSSEYEAAKARFAQQPPAALKQDD